MVLKLFLKVQNTVIECRFILEINVYLHEVNKNLFVLLHEVNKNLYICMQLTKFAYLHEVNIMLSTSTLPLRPCLHHIQRIDSAPTFTNPHPPHNFDLQDVETSGH